MKPGAVTNEDRNTAREIVACARRMLALIDATRVITLPPEVAADFLHKERTARAAIAKYAALLPN